MIRDIDQYYLEKEEPVKSCLQALRSMIVAYNPDITEAWKYRMPFFCYKGRMFCYVWVDRKTGRPYIGIMEGGKIIHPELIQDKRSRMKIMFIDPKKDLPLRTIREIFKKALTFYK